MRATFRTAAITVAALVGFSVPVAGASAYGTYNAFGQQAEHEQITRVLVQRSIESATLGLIAGQSGHLGGVGAPDNPLDSSQGLGPGYKHCDDGDWLDAPGYPNSKDAAQRALRECFAYFERQLDQAVAAAGQIVNADGAIVPAQAAASYDICRFPYTDDARDGSAKCVVVNRLGRALHLAEDFWSHSNWADTADPSRPVSATNPPGLERTDIPDALRYPGAATAAIPEGLISGCDDSVPLFGPSRCKNRVGHAALAKDNGVIDTSACAAATPTSKYPRGQVSDNFPASVCGAQRQVLQVWDDFASAVRATYGQRDGDLILQTIMLDTIPSGPVTETMSDEATPVDAISTESTPTSAATESPTASPIATASSTPVAERLAAGDEATTSASPKSATDALLPWTYALMVIVFAGIALGAWTFARRKES